jgi:hypothetical protein
MSDEKMGELGRKDEEIVLLPSVPIYDNTKCTWLCFWEELK